MSAALLPLAGDGLIAAASAAMLAAARNGKSVPARARVLLLAGIAATIAANVAYGLPDGLTGALLSVWPVACYVGCMELLTWMRENLGASARPAAASARAPKPDAPEVPDSPKVAAADLITTAAAKFPEAARGGRIPSLRVIQGELGVGQGKAQQVQAAFPQPPGGYRVNRPRDNSRTPRSKRMKEDRGVLPFSTRVREHRQRGSQVRSSWPG